MLTIRRHLDLAVLAAVIAPVSGALADGELQFDVNSISTRISTNSTGEVFGEDFTGSLRLGHDDDSILAGILIDGVYQAFDSSRTDGEGWAMSHFSAKINIEDGTVVGGYVILEVERFSDGRSAGEINRYDADITAGVGAVNEQVGQGTPSMGSPSTGCSRTRPSRASISDGGSACSR